MNSIYSGNEVVGQDMVRLGQQCLAAGDRAGAAQALLKARSMPETRLMAHNLIEQYGLEGSFAQMMGFVQIRHQLHMTQAQTTAQVPARRQRF